MEEASEPKDLDLLRLRVLATRKRPHGTDKEEGELSDSEPKNYVQSPRNMEVGGESSHHPAPPHPVSFAGVPLIPVTLHESFSSHRSYPQNGSTWGRKGKKKVVKMPRRHHSLSSSGHTDRFFETLSNEMESLAFVSDSFKPQACIVTLDSDISEDEQEEKKVSSLERENEVNNVEVAAKSKTYVELLQNELERQRQTLALATSQYETLLEESRKLESWFGENDLLIKSAVAKQLKLKEQLKETKQLIMKSKDMRTQNIKRKEQVEKDAINKKKLLSTLQGSIRAKEILNVQSGKVIKIDIKKEEKEEHLIVTNGLPTPSKRAVEIAALEKQSLKVKEELIAAQLKLMRNKKLRDKSSGTKKPLVTALSKIMAMNPLASESKAMQVEQVQDSKEKREQLDISSYFPSFLHSVSNHLIWGESLQDLIPSLGEFISTKATTGNEELDLDLNENTEYFEEYFEVERVEPKPFSMLKFEPYESPLRNFKSYRFSPHFPAVVPNQGLLSKSFTNRIKHEMSLCTDDLIYGKCSRNNCVAQHFKNIFLKDSLVLEDFMMTLLEMPIKEPFKSQSELLVYVKNKFRKASQRQQPLIALVGIIIDAFKQMNPEGSPHVISFKKRQESSVAVVKSLFESESEKYNSKKSAKQKLVLPFIDSRPCMLSGMEEVKKGNLPVMWRYFDAEKSLLECKDRINNNPKDISSWIELFLMSLSKNENFKEKKTFEEGVQVLHLAIQANPDSQILKTLYLDTLSLASLSVNSTLNSIFECWIKFGNCRHSYDLSVNCLYECLEIVTKEPSSNSFAVDIILAFVKIAIDLGHTREALGLLQICLTLNISGESSLFDKKRLLKSLKSVDFSVADVSYLAMMYFYVRDNEVYPHRAYLSFPWDLVRRLNFYYLQQWSKEQFWEEDLMYLKHLLVTVYMENPSNQVFDWIFNNLLNLADKLALTITDALPETILQADIISSLSSSSQLRILQYSLKNKEAKFGELEMRMVQGHPLILLGFIGIVLKTNEAEAVKEELFSNLLRVFWNSRIFNIASDASLLTRLVQCLGISEYFPYYIPNAINDAVNDVSNDVTLSPTISIIAKNDPFMWILAMFTFSLLGPQPSQSTLINILEVAISNSPEKSSVILLLTLMNSLVMKSEEQSSRIQQRIITICDQGGDEYPEANILNAWQSTLTDFGPTLNEFLRLNVESLDDFVSLSFDLLWPKSIVEDLNPKTLSLAYRQGSSVNINSGLLFQLLQRHPQDHLLWRLVMNVYREDKEALETQKRSLYYI